MLTRCGEDEVSARERREAGTLPHPRGLTAPIVAKVSPSPCERSRGGTRLWESYWGNNQALFFFLALDLILWLAPALQQGSESVVCRVGMHQEQV